jgi:plasmid stability protein
MATLVVRQVDEELVRPLKERARTHGRSAEAEHRAILSEALRPVTTGAELWAAMRGEGPWLDEAFDERLRAMDQPVEAADLGR